VSPARARLLAHHACTRPLAVPPPPLHPSAPPAGRVSARALSRARALDRLLRRASFLLRPSNPCDHFLARTHPPPTTAMHACMRVSLGPGPPPPASLPPPPLRAGCGTGNAFCPPPSQTPPRGRRLHSSINAAVLLAPPDAFMPASCNARCARKKWLPGFASAAAPMRNTPICARHTAPFTCRFIARAACCAQPPIGMTQFA